MARQGATSTLTAEQQARRLAGIGASEIPAVVGVDPYRTALDVWLEKTGRAEPFEGNEFTHWGNRLEGVIAAEYSERLQVSVRRDVGTWVHPEHDWCLCTPDAIAAPDPPTPDWGVECKNRNQFNVKAWGPAGTDEVPLEVAAQVHWSMFVTGFRRWDVAVLLGGNRLGLYELAFDEELAEALFHRAKHFWFEHVLPDVAPPLDGSASSARWLELKYPLHGEALKPPTPEVDHLAGELRTVREHIARLDEQKRTVEHAIKDVIGDAAGIELTGGGKITWKRPKPAEVVNWQMVVEGLKAQVDDDTYQTLVGIHTTQRKNTRRFLPQFPD